MRRDFAVSREVARALPRFCQGKFSDEPSQVEAVSDKFFCQKVEQFRMRGRIPAVVEVEWFHKAAAHELPPDAIGNVAGKERIVRRGKFHRQLPQRTELWNATS